MNQCGNCGQAFHGYSEGDTTCPGCIKEARDLRDYER